MLVLQKKNDFHHYTYKKKNGRRANTAQNTYIDQNIETEFL